MSRRLRITFAVAVVAIIATVATLVGTLSQPTTAARSPAGSHYSAAPAQRATQPARSPASAPPVSSPTPGPAPTPPATTTPAPRPMAPAQNAPNAIVQGGGGDHDPDNNGGPNDGDGTI